MSDLKVVLDQLKVEYLAALPAKIQTIKKLTENYELDLLREEYHKLKGTGKTYGFPDISVVCAKMEAMLSQNVSKTDGKILPQAAELLERMHQKYSKNEPFDLNQNQFARSLLALKFK